MQRVGHQVGLELSHVDVQGTVEAERCSQGGHDLGNEAVQVGVRGASNVQGAAAHVVQGLDVVGNGHVGVLQQL